MTPDPATTYSVTDGSLREFTHDAKNRIATITITAEVLRHRAGDTQELFELIDRIDRQAGQLNDEITAFAHTLRTHGSPKTNGPDSRTERTD
jgi:hypothetical protein